MPPSRRQGSRQEGLMVDRRGAAVAQPYRRSPDSRWTARRPCEVLRAVRRAGRWASRAPAADVRDAIARAAPEVLDGRSRGSVSSPTCRSLRSGALARCGARAATAPSAAGFGATSASAAAAGTVPRPIATAKRLGASVEFRWRAADRARGRATRSSGAARRRGGITPVDRTVADDPVPRTRVPAGAAGPGGSGRRRTPQSCGSTCRVSGQGLSRRAIGASWLVAGGRRRG